MIVELRSRDFHRESMVTETGHKSTSRIQLLEERNQLLESQVLPFLESCLFSELIICFRSQLWKINYLTWNKQGTLQVTN